MRIGRIRYKAMKWEEIGKQPCSIARTLSVVGDRWTLLILRNAFAGMRRFDEFHDSLGLTRHLLSERLKRLVEHQILMKQPYVDRQERMEYRLTEKGLELYPLLMAMSSWADKWMDEGLGSPVHYTHKSCGNVFKPIMVCSECGEVLMAKQVKAVFTQAYFDKLKQLEQAI